MMMELRTHQGSRKIADGQAVRNALGWMPRAQDGAFAVLASAPTHYIQAVLNGTHWVVEMRAGGPETHVTIAREMPNPPQWATTTDFGSSSPGTLTADEVIDLFVDYVEGQGEGGSPSGAIH